MSDTGDQEDQVPRKSVILNENEMGWRRSGLSTLGERVSQLEKLAKEKGLELEEQATSGEERTIKKQELEKDIARQKQELIDKELNEDILGQHVAEEARVGLAAEYVQKHNATGWLERVLGVNEKIEIPQQITEMMANVDKFLKSIKVEDIKEMPRADRLELARRYFKLGKDYDFRVVKPEESRIEPVVGWDEIELPLKEEKVDLVDGGMDGKNSEVVDFLRKKKEEESADILTYGEIKNLLNQEGIERNDAEWQKIEEELIELCNSNLEIIKAKLGEVKTETEKMNIANLTRALGMFICEVFDTVTFDSENALLSAKTKEMLKRIAEELIVPNQIGFVELWKVADSDMNENSTRTRFKNWLKAVNGIMANQKKEEDSEIREIVSADTSKVVAGIS